LARVGNIYLIARGPDEWTVLEEATGNSFASFRTYQEARDYGFTMAQKRRVQLVIPKSRDDAERFDFRPWWTRWFLNCWSNDRRLPFTTVHLAPRQITAVLGRNREASLRWGSPREFCDVSWPNPGPALWCVGGPLADPTCWPYSLGN